jgi:hypothetical protein
MMTASFLAVALIADTRPFPKLMRLKKSDNNVVFKLPIALAAFFNAIFNLLLPFAILLLNTFPPLTLLFGASRSHDANCFPAPNFFNPSNQLHSSALTPWSVSTQIILLLIVSSAQGSETTADATKYYSWKTNNIFFHRRFCVLSFVLL